jgi:hypothetical protein
MIRPDERLVENVPTEQVVRVPEAEPTEVHEPPRRWPGRLPDNAPWVILFVVGVIVALVLVALLLGGERGESGEPGGVRSGAQEELAITPTVTEPDLEAVRTHTVNVDVGQDVLAMAATSPASLAPYFGAPITADGVTVTDVFGAEAFVITSPAGGKMVVYVPPQGEIDLVLVSPGQEITFQGTLFPVREDFAFLVGTAAPKAQSTGAYLYAVPETIHEVEQGTT